MTGAGFIRGNLNAPESVGVSNHSLAFASPLLRVERTCTSTCRPLRSARRGELNAREWFRIEDSKIARRTGTERAQSSVHERSRGCSRKWKQASRFISFSSSSNAPALSCQAQGFHDLCILSQRQPKTARVRSGTPTVDCCKRTRRTGLRNRSRPSQTRGALEARPLLHLTASAAGPLGVAGSLR